MSKDLKKQSDVLENTDELELLENTKDFAEFEKYEAAYKNLKEQDAPDLWSRIEAGIAEDNKAEVNHEEVDITLEITKELKDDTNIEEKTAQTLETQDEKKEEVLLKELDENSAAGILDEQTKEKAAKEDNIISINKKSKKKYTKYIAAFSTMAAAILLCLAVLPVVMDGMKQSDSMSSMDNSTSSSSESEKFSSEESEDSYTMDNADTNGIIAEESVPQEKDIIPEEDTEKKNIYSMGETEGTSEGAQEEAVELIEIEDVSEEDLEKIPFSTLSKASQKQIKKLVENYKKCTFYVDETGEVYMVDEDIMYLVEGIYITKEN